MPLSLQIRQAQAAMRGDPQPETCGECDATIWYGTTVYGQKLPFDDVRRADGQYRIVEGDTRPVPDVEFAGGDGEWMNHYLTCGGQGASWME